MNLSDINTEIIQWDEQYNIGVGIVDKAHRQLFAIVRKIIELLDDEDSYKNEFACKEGLKFFKSYTVKHFAEEEAVMLSIHYEGYDRHRQIHETLKTRTLPELEHDLEATGYAYASVQRFLGVCIGWLTTHIMIEDRSITGRAIPLQKVNLLSEISDALTTAGTKAREATVTEAAESAQAEETDTELLDELEMESIFSSQLADPSPESLSAFSDLMKQLFHSVFQLNAETVSQRYNGWDVGKAVYYELRYKAPSGHQYRAVWMLEERLILAALGKMLGMKFQQTDEIVLSAMKEIAQMFMLQISNALSLEENYALSSDRLLKREQFEQVFHIHSPRYSLLFETAAGHFSFCLV